LEEIVRNVSLTLATTSTVVLDDVPSNARRKQFVITNTSTAGETVSIGHVGDALSGKGIVIYPTFTYQESSGSDFIPFQNRITALGSAATATISIHEVLQVNL